MACVRQLLALGMLVLSGIACAEPSSFGEDPRELLFRTMDKSRWLNFEAVVLRRNSSREHAFMQVKIAQKGGASKTTVLSPLPAQGVTTVDDGRTWSTYIPDENKMLIQDSPRRLFRLRTAAAGQNYRFTSEETGSVAGRKTVAVLAVPKAPEMPCRRYWIDGEYALMLRMEIIKDGGRRRSLMMDTKAIEFRTVADDAMKLNPPADVRRLVFESPERFRTADEAAALVGFRPAFPGPLPFGFIVSEPQIIGSKGGRYVAIRLSDGLASATVYQWSANTQNPVPCTDKDLVREANGLRMRVAGDLPDEVLARLLDAFVREALKGLQTLSGTDFTSDALLPLQKAGEANGVELILVIARDI